MVRNKCLSSVFNFYSQNLLLTLTIFAVVGGLSLGVVLKQLELSEEASQLINFPGEIFLRILKMMILPLIFSSLIAAIAQMDTKSAAQMGLLTLGYYALTTTLAIITGISLVLLIQPGTVNCPDEHLNCYCPASSNLTAGHIHGRHSESISRKPTFQRTQTTYQIQTTLSNNENVEAIVKKQVDYVDGMNILGVILFCICFGVVISSLGEKAKAVVDLFVVLEAAIMKLIEIFMWFAPVGIVSLIAGNMAELNDLSSAFKLLIKYMCTIFLGLGVHCFVTIPVLYVVLTRKNPIKLAKGMTQAVVTTFGTSSGERCHTSDFISMYGRKDGNALYEAVAVVFIAQLNGIHLGIAEVITVSLIATIASLGLNSVPAGLVSILLILNTIGLPTKDVAMLLTIDWLIDRIRSALNVLGDGFAASVVAHHLRSQLKAIDKQHDFHQESNLNVRQPIITDHQRTPINRTRSFSFDVAFYKNQSTSNFSRDTDSTTLPITQL
ncbi:Amino acid transporter [Aphelenchoides bicaudatus]|nr:Amino acid transporter [Aphelenchoides bicaudatus]